MHRGRKVQEKAKECVKLPKMYRPCNQVQKLAAKHSAQIFLKNDLHQKKLAKNTTKNEKHSRMAVIFT